MARDQQGETHIPATFSAPTPGLLAYRTYIAGSLAFIQIDAGTGPVGAGAVFTLYKTPIATGVRASILSATIPNGAAQVNVPITGQTCAVGDLYEIDLDSTPSGIGNPLTIVLAIAETGANQTDAFLLARANHTGTQLAATISDFASAVNALIVGYGALVNPMTTAGDIIVGGVSGGPTRVAKGANNTVWGVDASGTLGYKADPTGGGGTAKHSKTPSGTINGSNVNFTIPDTGLNGTLRLYKQPSGSSNGYLRLPLTAYSEDVSYTYDTPDETTGKTAFESSHFGGDVAANAIDDNSGTHWGSNTLQTGHLGVDFGSAKKIGRVKITPNTSGGYSILKDFVIEYSDDNASYFSAGTFLAANTTSQQTFSFGDFGAHRYWRIRVTTAYSNLEPSFAEVEMMLLLTVTSTFTTFTMTTAPATGDLLLCDYEV